MLAFTLRVIIADIQKSFRGLWIILYIGILGILIVVPFYGGALYFLFYAVFAAFSVLEQNISKIFYVLPLGSKLLRRYIYLRSILLASFFLISGGIMTVVSWIWHVPRVEKGWLMIMLYIQICLMMSLANTVVTTRKSKNTFVMVPLIILMLGSIVNAIFLIDFLVQLCISIISIIVSEVLIIGFLQKVNLTNYVEPVYFGLLARSRNVQRAQINTSETEKKR